MQTNWSNRSSAFGTQHDAASRRPRPKAALVNGSVHTLFELDTLLGGAAYDVVLVDSEGLAYSQIKHDRPDVIVLCARADDLDAVHVLSMLQLDEDTRHIPVHVYTARAESGDEDGETAEPSVDRIPGYRPAQRMN